MLFMLLNILPHILLQFFFSYFPPLKPSASYGPEIRYVYITEPLQ